MPGKGLNKLLLVMVYNTCDQIFCIERVLVSVVSKEKRELHMV